MLSIKGTYKDGVVKLDQPITSNKSRKVIVTFLDEEHQEEHTRLTKRQFSFSQSREQTKRYKGNLSDAIIDERRNER